MSKKVSKKDRLRKQAERQQAMRREEELEEERSRQAARVKGRQSMAAKKMRRAARRGYSGKTNILMALAMAASYIYSGLIFGTFTVYGTFSGIAEPIPGYVAWAMLAGMALMAAGVVLAFRGRRILQGIPNLSGSVSYLWAAVWVIRDLEARTSRPGTDPGLYGMPGEYRRYYLPILVLTALSAAMLIMGLSEVIQRRRRERAARENAPVKSIIDD